jgi:hypothetical protein
MPVVNQQTYRVEIEYLLSDQLCRRVDIISAFCQRDAIADVEESIKKQCFCVRILYVSATIQK